MALVDIDTWTTEFAACERLSRDIQSQIVTRNQQPRLSTEYSKISHTIRFKLKQFQTNLEQLNSTIAHAASQGSVTTLEAERRQRQVENLQSEYVHLQSQFVGVSNGENSERNDLLNNGKSVYWQGDDDDDDDDILNTDIRSKPSASNEYSIDDLRKQQNRILDDQNEGLEALSKVISRQKHLALRIGDEFDEQNDIIDTLTTTMDSTNARISGATRGVDDAIQTESTKCYWLMIIGLFALNIIVAIL